MVSDGDAKGLGHLGGIGVVMNDRGISPIGRSGADLSIAPR